MMENSSTVSMEPLPAEQIKERRTFRRNLTVAGKTVSKGQQLRENSYFCGRLFEALPRIAIKEAKTGKRNLRLVQIIEDDIAGSGATPKEIPDASVFRYGSIPHFLCNALLQAGFKIYVEKDDEQEVLVMSW